MYNHPNNSDQVYRNLLSFLLCKVGQSDHREMIRCNIALHSVFMGF